MNDLSAVACPICEQQPVQALFVKRVEGRAYPLVRCPGCRLVFVATPPTEQELVQHHDQLWVRAQHQDLVQEEAIEQQFSEQRFRRRLDELARFVSPGRLLDVGCRDGLFLALARERGWHPSGVEEVRAAAEQAKQRSVEVFVGTLAEAHFPDASFDVVTLWHLIEHVTQPLLLLQEIHRLLKPTGLLAIETPNIESRAFHRHGPDWEYLVPPRHLCYFGPQSLKIALEHIGFTAVFLRCEGGTGVGRQLAQAGLGGGRLWLRKHYRSLQPLKALYLILFGWQAPIDDIVIMYARATPHS